MTREKFNKIVERRLRLIGQVLMKKQKEYANSDDVFHNFARAGEFCKLSKEKSLQVMWAKHLVSISDMIDSKKPFSHAFIEEKIGDAINYLILLEGMLKERA